MALCTCRMEINTMGIGMKGKGMEVEKYIDPIIVYCIRGTFKMMSTMDRESGIQKMARKNIMALGNMGK